MYGLYRISTGLVKFMATKRLLEFRTTYEIEFHGRYSTLISAGPDSRVGDIKQINSLSYAYEFLYLNFSIASEKLSAT